MKTNKIVLTTILMAVILMTVIPSVLASGTLEVILNSPKRGNNYTGTVNFTATTNATKLTGSFNVSLICDRLGTTITAADTWLVTVKNTTKSQNLSTSPSVSISGQTDALTWNCSAYADNGSVNGRKWSAAIPVITFDSTAPVCTIEAMKNQIPYKGTIDITWSITDALALKTSHMTVDGPELASLIIDTTATTTRTLLSQETKYVGTWNVNASGTDNSGNVCTLASDTFKTYLPDQVGAPEYEEPTEPTGIPSNLLLIGIVIVVLWLIFRKKN